jgi:hypothetical protein
MFPVDQLPEELIEHLLANGLFLLFCQRTTEEPAELGAFSRRQSVFDPLSQCCRTLGEAGSQVFEAQLERAVVQESLQSGLVEEGEIFQGERVVENLKGIERVVAICCRG